MRSDIFISYSNSDLDIARTLAESLEKKGWSVWWDRRIPPGLTFDQVIEKALNETKCVIVLWSKDSINSSWVKEEASEGLRRNILVPALIDDVKIPLGFKRLPAANLVDWSGASQHSGFDEIGDAITTIVGKPKSAETEKSSESKKQVESKVSRKKPEVKVQAKKRLPKERSQDIFISHSSQDLEFVEALVDLIEATLKIKPEIRCTSVPGYKLKTETKTDERLRIEINDARLLMGVITPSSMKSAYVLFELGARWVIDKPMFPIIACGADSSILKRAFRTY